MTEMDAILRTIREVEESLERRYARAEGATLAIWGLVGASIFAFYQLVEWNPEPYAAALGPALSWVWLLPMALGAVATMLVGARLGRAGATAEQRRALRLGLIPGAVTTVAVTALLLTGRYHAIYGVVPLVCGISFLAFAWPAPRGPTRALSLAVGALMSLAGVALLDVDAPWASGAAALLFLAGFGAVGIARYRAGR